MFECGEKNPLTFASIFYAQDDLLGPISYSLLCRGLAVRTTDPISACVALGSPLLLGLSIVLPGELFWGLFWLLALSWNYCPSSYIETALLGWLCPQG